MASYYMNLVESCVRRFEFGRDTPTLVRFEAALALSALVTLNIVTLAILGYGITGIMFPVIFANLPFNLAALCLLVALHWHLVGRVQHRNTDINATTLERSSSGASLVVWHLAGSVLALISAAIFTGLRT